MEDVHERELPLCIAFEGTRCIASGALGDVVTKVKPTVDRGGTEAILLFDMATSDRIDVDFHGTPDEVLARLTSGAVRKAHDGDAARSTHPPTRGPGRPRLGVVAREVTLLPRHWDWLNRQPGGASVALRRLVDDARRVHGGRDRVREAQEAAYCFMSALAGDLPGFEEASRALFAADAARFAAQVSDWPADVREHCRRLSAPAFEGAATN